MTDDRAEFERHTRSQSVALGKDKAVFERSIDLLLDLDRYDYSYLWSWMGVPIIQLPADIMATQEVIWATKPDIIIEKLHTKSSIEISTQNLDCFSQFYLNHLLN